MAKRSTFTADACQEIQREMRAATSASIRNKRRFGRVRPEGVWCSHGRILDLSATGLRLQRARPLRGEDVIELRFNGHRIAVRVQVVWCVKRGFAKHEMGLHFLELPAEHAQLIHQMAMFG